MLLFFVSSLQQLSILLPVKPVSSGWPGRAGLPLPLPLLSPLWTSGPSLFCTCTPAQGSGLECLTGRAPQLTCPPLISFQPLFKRCLLPPHYLFFLFGSPWHMEFLGQGSDLCCSCNPRCSCGNAGFPNPLCQAGGSNLHIVPEMLPILSCHSGNSPQHYLIFPTQNYNFSLLESIYSHHTPASTLYNPFTCYIFLPLQTEGKLHEGSVCGSLLFDLFQN